MATKGRSGPEAGTDFTVGPPPGCMRMTGTNAGAQRAPGLGEARFPQLLLDVHEEILVDLFAGGGGASLGIEMATGRQVDVAINHDPIAVALHRVNHPQTTHHVCDVFEADPRVATNGRPVGLLWASPDCTDHSKAKGGKPFRDSARKRRALAWVVTRWAGQVRPRVIVLENVEEFAQWGPLVGPRGELRRCPKRKGQTFRAWVRSLKQLGSTWFLPYVAGYYAATIAGEHLTRPEVEARLAELLTLGQPHLEQHYRERLSQLQPTAL